MTANDIILRARDTLADPTGDRWSDDRLLRLLDEGHKTICYRAKALRSYVEIVVNPDQANYSMPIDFLYLTKALYNGDNLKITSRESINSTTYIDSLGTPTNIIVDKLNKGVVQLAPIPSFVENDPFDITKANILGIYYASEPQTISDLTDILDLDDSYKPMLVKYVSGYALRDDMDTQNRIFGNEEIAMFEGWLAKVTTDVSKDFTNHNRYEVTYKGFQ